jgi:hypothetical protein
MAPTFFRLQTKTKDTDTALKIVVSRSHSGKVESVAKSAFGENVKVGHIFQMLERFWNDIHASKSNQRPVF